MMREIRIRTVGKIMSGDDEGRFVEVVDDSLVSGGFLILTYDNSDRTGDGFDAWVESIVDVDLYFEESGWCIEWQSERN